MVCSGCVMCESGEEEYGNTPEGEIAYLKIFLKSLQLTKLEMFLLVLFEFISNLPQRGKKRSVNNNAKAFLR